ncbi:uncharacterized protein LOC119291042 isoform X2 [Triticum dicoccoides]|uniref:uncharacterized protein LOC119291042 isoform X2 n=1 Tax=Triticum dicoccoides TaxID=85692 RepID=UPI000E7CFEE9|nr:uncharacterized protein LOC119291042 isoform X2 [Triticum dicoccoides]
MGTRAATSAPVAAVSSILFGRSLPQTLLLTTAHCWGFPPWMRRRTTSAAWRSSSGCFLERSREMGSSPNAGAAVLPDGLHPAVLGCISWWWHGFIERSYKYREQRPCNTPAAYPRPTSCHSSYPSSCSVTPHSQSWPHSQSEGWET